MSDVTIKTNPIIGYRSTIGTTIDKIYNISIVQANKRHIVLYNLKPFNDYIFKVQAITTHGIGTIKLLHKFNTKQFLNVSSNKQMNLFDSEVRFELPLESSNTFSFRNCNLIIFLLRISINWFVLSLFYY